MRDRSRAPFTPAKVKFVRAIAPAVGAALRALATREAAMSSSRLADGGPGIALYDDAGTLLSLDGQAELLFAEHYGPVVHAPDAPVAHVEY